MGSGSASDARQGCNDDPWVSSGAGEGGSGDPPRRPHGSAPTGGETKADADRTRGRTIEFKETDADRARASYSSCGAARSPRTAAVWQQR
eukprot:gene23168-biopygen17792